MAELKTGTTIGGNTVWHSGNDGTGSGLDSDTVDGHNSDYFANATTTQTALNSKQNTITNGAIGNINDPLVYIPFKRANDEVRLSGVQNFIRASTGTYIDPLDGLLKTAAINEPRFERMADGDIGILMEGTSTNTIPANQYRTCSNWYYYNGALSYNDAIGIDGIDNSAFTVTDTDNSTINSRIQIPGIHLYNTYSCTVSFFVKKNSAINIPRFLIVYGDGSSIHKNIYLDTNTGELSNDSYVDTKVFDYNEWWRISINNLNTEYFSSPLIIYPSARSTLNGQDDGTLTGSVVVDWAQLELDMPFATSPIPGGATRALDLLSLEQFGNATYTMPYVTIIADYDTFGKKLDVTMSQNIFSIYIPQYSLEAVTFNGLTISYLNSSWAGRSPAEINIVQHIGGRNDGINDSLWLNGVHTGTDYPDQGVQNFSSSLKIYIGKNLYGHIRNFKIYDKALTDLEMTIA